MLSSPPARVDRVDNVLVYVVGVDVAPGPTTGTRLHTVRVVILTGHELPERADDHLDVELDKLAGLLDAHPAIPTWKATRDVFGTDPGWHGYGVEFELITQRPERSNP